MITDLNHSHCRNRFHVTLLPESNFDARLSFEAPCEAVEADEIPDLEEICADDRALKSFVIRGVERIKRSRYLLFKEIYKLGCFIDGVKKKSSDDQFDKIRLILREDIGISENEQNTALKLYRTIKALPDPRRRQLASIDKPIWNLSLLNKLCQLSEQKWEEFSCSLAKLKRRAKLGYSSLKNLIESFIPPKYLKGGQPFKDIDRELIQSKLKLSQDILTTIVEKAQENAAHREDPTLQTDDVISALTEAGYDTAAILPPPYKKSNLAQAKAQAEQAQKIAKHAIATSKQLSLQLEEEKSKSAEAIARLEALQAEKKHLELELAKSKTATPLKNVLSFAGTASNNNILKFSVAGTQAQINPQNFGSFEDALTAATQQIAAIAESQIAKIKAHSSGLLSNLEAKLGIQLSHEELPDVGNILLRPTEDETISLSVASEPVQANASINIPNLEEVTTSPIDDAASGEFSHDPIDAHPETLAESGMASVFQKGGNSTATASCELQQAQRFVKGAIVGLLDKTRLEFVKRGKMISTTGQQVLVHFFDGKTGHFNLNDLCILEMPQTYKGFA